MKLVKFGKRVQAALVLLTISTMTIGSAQSLTLPLQNSNAIAQKVIERLLGEQTQFRLGQLPENLSAQIPLPEKSQLLGSATYNPENVQILLDVPQSYSEVLDFYNKRLTSSGWEKNDNSYLNSKGFVESNYKKGVSFCKKGSQDAELSVNAKPLDKSLTDLRLNLTTGRPGTKCQQQYPGGDIPLPALVAPPNTTLIDPSGGGNENSTDSRVKLETKLDGKSIAAYYEDQFQSAGWKRQDGGQSGTTAWSSWTLKDKKGNSWQSFLYITKLENKPNQYFASANASLL